MVVQEIDDRRLVVNGFGNGYAQISGSVNYAPLPITFVDIQGMTFLADGMGCEAECVLDNI